MSSDSSPSAKRQRTENAPITRSDIWHSDGSVVLQAEDTQFRVHWSVLALHSSFFRDMQGLPQPPEQPSVDGCPVVELQDTVADVEYLFKALYSPTFLTQEALPLPVVAALIRLGRKYDFRELLDQAVERLTFENPMTLEKYDALIKDGKNYGPTRIVYYRGMFYDILTLARENNILSVLPCAYYRSLIYHTQEDSFDGIPRMDGSLAALAPIDQRRCVVGRTKLLKVQLEPGYPRGWLRSWPSNNGCANILQCTENRLEKYTSYHVLYVLNTYANQQPKIQRLFCSACQEHIEETVEAGRRKIWEELPGFFDLPPWIELKNDLYDVSAIYAEPTTLSAHECPEYYYIAAGLEAQELPSLKSTLAGVRSARIVYL
ncbi:hypothetical protein C8R44DRAFT_980335 [Mycena epipterygia]|nr:hypothetical protein C8R44DRAFT_980335 [Mycena epipterygia]